MNNEIINDMKEKRREIHEGIKTDVDGIKTELMQNENVRREVRKVSGVKRYFRKLLDMRGDMMSYEDIGRMMDENTEIHGSNMWILMLAIFIASIGLNVNSTAVIIGAMLVSPLMSGIMSMGYSLAVRDLSLLQKAAMRFGTQVVISLIASTVYFMISPLSEPTAEMIARTSPTLWDVLIALFGGIAGMIGNTRKVKGNVVPGVAIATALMPPLCTVGYGIAHLDAKFILGAGYLFLINTLFIALSTAFVALVIRVPKVRTLSAGGQKRVNIIVTAITVIAIVPSVYIGAMTVYNSVVSTNINNYINREFVFSDAQVVQTSTDNDNKIINVSIIGEHISEQTINMLRGQLSNYGLSDYKLRVTQNMIPDFSQTDDTERITIAVQESRLTELEAELEKKQNEYDELQSRYDEIISDADSIIDYVSVAEKASMIFTELEESSFGYMSSATGSYYIFTAQTDYPISDERSETINNWLLAETGADFVEMNIVNRYDLPGNDELFDGDEYTGPESISDMEQESGEVEEIEGMTELPENDSL